MLNQLNPQVDFLFSVTRRQLIELLVFSTIWRNKTFQAGPFSWFFREKYHLELTLVIIPEIILEQTPG